MADAQIEALLLLGYLAIALIAVAIAVYAISVSYLSKEMRKVKRMILLFEEEVSGKKEELGKHEREQDKLSRKFDEKKMRLERIASMSDREKRRISRDKLEEERRVMSAFFKAAQSKLQRYYIGMQLSKKSLDRLKKRLKALKSRIFWLSYEGAVVLPCLFFGIAFLISCVGIYAYSDRVDQILLPAAVTMVVGFIGLLRTLHTVDSVATTISVPFPRLYFASMKETERFSSGKHTKVFFAAINEGEEKAENVEVTLHFPSLFGLQKRVGYEIVREDKYSDHPNHRLVIFKIKRLSMDFPDTVSVDLVTPREHGSYEVPVEIRERKSGLSTTELIFEIEKKVRKSRRPELQEYQIEAYT